MRKNKLCLFVGGVITALFLCIFTSALTLDVSAASSADSIYKKTLLNAIKTCYSDSYMKKSVLGTDYSGPYSLMAGSQNIVNNATGSKGFKDGTIKVPSQYGNSLDDADMSCYQLFTGWRENKGSNSAKGLLTLYNKTVPENKLPNIGYEKQDVSGDYKQGCISFKYTAPNGSGGSKDYKTNEICIDIDSDKKVDVYTNPSFWTSKGSADGKISLYVVYDYGWQIGVQGPDGLYNLTQYALDSGGGRSWDDVQKDVKQIAESIDGWINPATYESYGFHFNGTNANLGNEDHYAEYVRAQSGDVAATKALRYFAGSGKTWDSIKFNDEDRYTLYTAYIERYISDSNYPSVYIGSDSKCSGKLDDAKKETGYAYRKDKATWCPLYGVEDGNVPKLNGIDSSNTKLKEMSFKDIVNEMMKSKYDTYAAAEGSNNIGSADPGDEDENETEDASPCSQAGQSLGWIICPVVQMVGEAASGIYGYIEQNYLQMNPDFIDDDGTREAWGIFQGFANIVFVILLSIIILSQITGYGVTNYGIKKMLPTVIMMAVLVNLSFFLCEVAVDISNIVGYSGKQIFTDIGMRVTGAGADVGDSTASLGSMVQGLAMTFLTGTGTVVGLVIAYNTVEFWILPLLLMMLVALISIIFFFILLGVRQAGIIILVTLAPIAIICYALPNTKKIFERWWKLFFALLLVYPICGILMGGGQFASRLLLKVGSGDDGMKFSYAFVAVLLQAIPLFFVPSILKSSMSAMGNIGMKLSNFGRGISRGATGAIRKSEGYKDLQARMGGHNAQRMLDRAGWNQRHRILGAPGRLKNRAGEKIRSGNGRLAEMANNSYSRKQARRQELSTEQQLKNARAGYMADGNYQQRLDNRMESEHERYINSMADDIELANAEIATNDEEMGRRHAAALAAFNDDPTSDQNIATLRAYQNMLNKSGDGGRRAMFDNYAQDIHDHGGEVRAGTQAAAQHLIREHARDIKPKSRDFFGALGDISKGEMKGSFQTFTTGEGDNQKTHWMSSEYGAKSVGGFDAASLTQADEGTLDRYIAQAQQGGFDDAQRAQLEEYTRHALDGQHNLHAQGKIANKMNQLREAMGYTRVTQNSNSRGSTDSGSLPIRGGNGSSGPAPVPNNFTENDNGIVIPRNGQSGDMTGSQIRDFERQMRQHNNGGRNNNGGGGIILP